MRGEYADDAACGKRPGELPPRARRIHIIARTQLPHEGTTSACAENTRQTLGLPEANWNYLRVRGEYILSGIAYSVEEELPPRARRILGKSTTAVVAGGTTSACAENTVNQSTPGRTSWNYLRVRGEYHRGQHCNRPLGELPPRARRILVFRV